MRSFIILCCLLFLLLSSSLVAQENSGTKKETIAFLQQGGVAYMQENYKEAADFYLKFVMAQKSKNPNAEAMALFQEGSLAYMKGNYQVAADLYLKAGLMIGQKGNKTSTSKPSDTSSTTSPSEPKQGPKPDVKAWYKTGEEYYFGDKGKAVNYREALKWFQKASDGGHAHAAQILSIMYEKGQGVVQNKREAVRYLRLAAERGDPKAQTLLGIYYYEGERLPLDKKESLKWHQLAADQGITISQRYLGSLYSKGEAGIPVDNKKAFLYAWLAYSAKDEKAAQIVTLIADHVGRDVANTWIPEAQVLLDKINANIRRKHALNSQ